MRSAKKARPAPALETISAGANRAPEPGDARVGRRRPASAFA